jgi:hypothetical protein
MRLKTVAASGKADKSQRRSVSKSVSQIVPSSSVGVALGKIKLEGGSPDGGSSSSDSDDDSSNVSDSIRQSRRDPSKKGSKKHRKQVFHQTYSTKGI